MVIFARAAICRLPEQLLTDSRVYRPSNSGESGCEELHYTLLDMSNPDDKSGDEAEAKAPEKVIVIQEPAPSGPATISLTASGNLAGVSLVFSGSKEVQPMPASAPKEDDKAEAGKDGAKPDEKKKDGEDQEGKGPGDKNAKKPGGKSLFRRPGVMGLVILVVIVAVIAVVLFWRHSRAHQTTDDAFIDVVSMQVSPQVSGRILQVLVTDNQSVTAGQVLVKLDPADYEVKRVQAQASRAQADAQLKEAQAQGVVYAAQVEEAKANLGTARANQTNAANQLRRLQKLKGVNAGAVSSEQMDSAQAAATSANAQVTAGLKSVSAAEAQVGYAKSLEAAAQAGISSADASIRQAELTLSYTDVKARVDGRVASKTVSEGNIVAAGTPLMAVVPRTVYVTANFKETQLARMRPGQPVDIQVDAYPDMKLTGKVDSVQAASGQAFSELPAQNATGNWVKVVQRIPVKIVFDKIPDDPQRPLGPGMSVEISVKVR